MQKITGPDPSAMTGFVLVDLDGAEHADGIVRAAKKILVDGAGTLARSRTYAWALMGQRCSGASAGINVAPDARADGVAAFVEAVTERVASGALSLDAGKGVDAAELAPLDAVDHRSALRNAERPSGTLADELLAAGAVAAAAAAGAGGLDGRRVTIEGAGTALRPLLSALDGAGARVVAVSTPSGSLASPTGLDVADLDAALAEHGDGAPAALGSEAPADLALSTEADVLMCGSKVGLVDHELAAELPHQLIVPVGAVPVTAKGLAVASRRDIVVLPDFLTTAGPLHAFRPGDGATAEDVLSAATEHAATLAGELREHPEGPVLGACYRAEEFLRTWVDQLPFGRPLA